MTDLEVKIEVEAEEFTEELFDEALDREGAPERVAEHRSRTLCLHGG